MSREYFVSVLHGKYSALPPSERVRMIRELVAESQENAAFIRGNFPDFYAEAFPAFPKPNAKARTKRTVDKIRPKRTARRRKR